jgi:hypothetical protein
MLLSVDQSIQLVSNAWIERGGPIFWPPRSPDLTPMEFLWEYVKNFVYGEKNQNILHVRCRITATSPMVTPDMIQQIGTRANMVSIPAERQMDHTSKHTKVRRKLKILVSKLTIESCRYINSF